MKFNLKAETHINAKQTFVVTVKKDIKHGFADNDHKGKFSLGGD